MDNCSRKEKKDLSLYLPRDIQGWKPEEKDQTYNPQTIFDYIDGAGEVYRSYNFKELMVRRFRKKNKPEVIVDFFNMASSEDAFGVFTHDLEGEDAGIGEGSTYKGGLLSFWKGHFFVSIYAEEESEEIQEVLFDLGQAIASAIKEKGKKPDLLDLLPSEYIDVKSVHFFHNHTVLNYHFFVSDENIFLLDQQTEAVLATSNKREENYRLLLIKYHEEGKASRAYKSFTQVYMPDAVEPGLVKTEDMKWTSAKALEDLLLIIFDVSSDAIAKEMMEKTEEIVERVKHSQNE